MAARHVLELFCEDLKSGRSVDPALVAYIFKVLCKVIELKDERDKRRDQGERLESESKYYRSIAKALNFIDPPGRPRKWERDVAVSTEVVERMNAGETLERAAATIEEREKSIGNVKDIYTRYKLEGKANVGLKESDGRNSSKKHPKKANK